VKKTAKIQTTVPTNNFFQHQYIILFSHYYHLNFFQIYIGVLQFCTQKEGKTGNKRREIQTKKIDLWRHRSIIYVYIYSFFCWYTRGLGNPKKTIELQCRRSITHVHVFVFDVHKYMIYMYICIHICVDIFLYPCIHTYNYIIVHITLHSWQTCKMDCSSRGQVHMSARSST